MEITYIVVGAFLAVLVGFLYNMYSNRNNVYGLLLEKFGSKPENREHDFDKIMMYWKETENIDYRGRIDNITWNDLNMDKVFARINMCCSSIGEQYLYKSLRNINFEERAMESLEEKIVFMEENQEKRIEVQKKLLSIGKRKNNYYIPSFLRELNSYKLNNIWVYYILQAMLFIAIGLSVVLQHVYVYALLGIIFLVNINTYALMKNKYEINMDLIVIIQNILQISKKIAKRAEKTVFGSFEEKLGTINKLTKSMALLNGRYQRKYTADFTELCSMYITGAFLFDFVLYNRVLKKLENNLIVIRNLFDLLGELDMAITIASFRNSLSFYCLPEFCEECGICYKDIYNPLVDNPVCNDFNLNNNCIVTGSNASGKSTFIKAIAINEILAMSIHTCTAKAAKISRAEVYTSMAVRDDLLAGESYFVKEIKSLQRIIKAIEQGRFVIAVIDEFLRGTNTRERISASAAILRYLENKKCIVIVASHDIELINLMKSNRYDNYYFCESTERKEVIFDYKIHKGICGQRNAIKLLEFFGFPKNIVEDANKYLNSF